jgi:PHP family Zn ribbon phosphoesterase
MCERKVVTVNRTAAAVPGLHAPHAGHVARSRHDNQVAMTVHNFANGLIRVHPMGGGAYMYVDPFWWNNGTIRRQRIYAPI